MSSVIEARHLTKRYKNSLALDDVSFDIEENTIYGFLGRNGAGKTTAMSVLTAQDRQSSGEVRVFGERPYENPAVLSRMCFVREGQRYPEDATVRIALAAAKMFFPHWDADLAADLVDEFRIPLCTRIKKLSRGQNSAVGIVIGLAARAEITFFDEPYLGLDAVARQIFYDRLLEEYAKWPRTVVLSSHLIDEVANILERVLVIDQGRIVMDTTADEARSQATHLVGPARAVEPAVKGHEILHRESLGSVTSVTVLGTFEREHKDSLAEQGVEFAPVSLQQLIVRRTQRVRTDLPTAIEEGILR